MNGDLLQLRDKLALVQVIHVAVKYFHLFGLTLSQLALASPNEYNYDQMSPM